MRNPAAAAAAQHLDPHHPHHQGKYVDLQKTQHNFLSFQQQTPRPISSMAMDQTLNPLPHPNSSICKRETSISILFVVPTTTAVMIDNCERKKKNLSNNNITSCGVDSLVLGKPNNDGLQTKGSWLSTPTDNKTLKNHTPKCAEECEGWKL